MATDGLHWTIAIALYLFGSFLAAMGINSMKLALDRDEEARAAGKTEPLLSDGSSASDSTSGGGGYGTLESGGDEELLGGSAPVVKPSAFEAAKATVRVALLPRRDRCRCCCASAYDCLDAQAGAVLDVVMWLLRLFPMLWYVGLGSLLMGQVFVFPSFSLANQSVLCTLGSVQFPLNLLFVVIVLKARPPIISWIGVVLIVVGDSLVVGFSKNKDVELGVDELQALWTYGGITASEATFNPLTNTTMKEHIPGNPHNIVYLCFLFSVGVLCFILPAVYQIVVPTSPTLVKLCVGDAVPSDAIKATLAKSNVVGFFFALASAIFGSQCMTFVKSVMEVVTLSLFPKKGTAANFEGLTHAYFYLCILVVLVTGIWWGIRLQLVRCCNLLCGGGGGGCGALGTGGCGYSPSCDPPSLSPPPPPPLLLLAGARPL